MAKIIYTCPRCGYDFVNIVLDSNLPIYQCRCPNCGRCHTEEREDVIRVPFGGNLGNGAFGNLACLRCPTNPANGGDGICFCTLGRPCITY